MYRCVAKIISPRRRHEKQKYQTKPGPGSQSDSESGPTNLGPGENIKEITQAQVAKVTGNPSRPT